MIDIHQAIYALNSSIVTINGDVAYDKDNNQVTYDKSQAEAKLAELQAAEVAAQQAQATAKASAISKLTALGLTQDEINALIG
jgi:roadblock/LC7 domain-containing protein